MRRGEIWTTSGASDYAGKARPVVIVQDDVFDATRSITVCGFTTHGVDAADIRPSIEPSARNGLQTVCRLMVDKVTTVPKSKLGAMIGRLEDEDLVRLNRALLVFLGLARSPRRNREAERA